MVNTFFFDQESFDPAVILVYISSYPIYNILDFVMSFPSFLPFNVCDVLMLHLLCTSSFLVSFLNHLYFSKKDIIIRL